MSAKEIVLTSLPVIWYLRKNASAKSKMVVDALHERLGESLFITLRHENWNLRALNLPRPLVPGGSHILQVGEKNDLVGRDAYLDGCWRI